jgi:hypothetical protein
MNHDSYALLVKCARLVGDRPFYTQLQTDLANFTAWDALITLAEAQSMAPLLYHHLQKAEVPLSSEFRLQLQGLILRHRQANAIRLNVLSHILDMLAEAGIQVLVLKGGALAPLVYVQVGLRPMSDLDLLVTDTAAQEAQNLLWQAGFRPNTEAQHIPSDHRHLPVLMMQQDGLTVSVEIHRQLLGGLWAQAKNPSALVWDAPLSFSLNGRPAYTLAPIHMLWHLCHHTLAEPARLIRLVDITAVAEKYVEEIDWTAVRQTYPEIIAFLSNLHFVTPLSENLRDKAGIILKRKPAGTELALADWPPLPRMYWPDKTYRQILQATFLPSEFSLRLFYGIPNHRSHLWHRWLHHPLQILWWWLARRLPS